MIDQVPEQPPFLFQALISHATPEYVSKAFELTLEDIVEQGLTPYAKVHVDSIVILSGHLPPNIAKSDYVVLNLSMKALGTFNYLRDTDGSIKTLSITMRFNGSPVSMDIPFNSIAELYPHEVAHPHFTLATFPHAQLLAPMMILPLEDAAFYTLISLERAEGGYVPRINLRQDLLQGKIFTTAGEEVVPLEGISDEDFNKMIDQSVENFKSNTGEKNMAEVINLRDKLKRHGLKPLTGTPEGWNESTVDRSNLLATLTGGARGEVDVFAGDCGSPNGVKFVLNEQTVEGLIGRTVINEDGTQTKINTLEEALAVQGPEVEVRTPLYCGVSDTGRENCEVCCAYIEGQTALELQTFNPLQKQDLSVEPGDDAPVADVIDFMAAKNRLKRN